MIRPLHGICIVLFAISSARAQAKISACSQPGAEAGAQINAAIKEIVATGIGGTVDATCYSGDVNVASNMFAGVSTSLPITVQLAPATFIFAASGAQQKFTLNNFTLEGTGAYETTIEFNDPANDIFVLPNAGGGANVTIQNLVIEQSSSSHKTGGNVFNIQGQRDTIRNIKLTDPYNGFYVYNALNDTFKDLWFYTRRAGTLNYAIYLYGTDIDDFFENIYGATSFPIGTSFLHIRNRVSGVRFTNFSFQSNSQTSAAPGILIDCGSSPISQRACTDAYSASPENRPELLHFDEVYIEAGLGGNAVTIKGGQDIRFANSYFASSLTGFSISGPSTAVSITNSFIVHMQHQCIYVATGDITVGYASLSIDNNNINACSQGANQKYPAIELAKSINSVGIIGNQIGHNAFNNFAFDSPVAVRLDGVHNGVRILNNDFTSVRTDGSSYYTNLPIQGPSSPSDVWMDNVNYPSNNTPTTAGASVR